MIKRILFDMDDTLVMSLEMYKKCIVSALKAKNIKVTNSLVQEIEDSFAYYEEENDMHNEQKYIEFFNKKYGYNFNVDLVKEMNHSFAVNAANESNPNVKETLEYLSKKYELVILTNYYYEVQKKRLEIMGIDKYFKIIYAGNKIPCKPRKESYNISRGDYKFNECLVIGDSLTKDYLAPIEFGMEAILFDKHNKYKKENYRKINDFKELISIL